LREAVNPGPFSMMNIDRPLRAGSACGSVRTSTAQQLPSMPLLIQVLVPLTT
jgi:hypothetical protein